MRCVAVAAVIALLVAARAEAQCLAPTQQALCGGGPFNEQQLREADFDVVCKLQYTVEVFRKG